MSNRKNVAAPKLRSSQRKTYSKKRAATLLFVYVLMAAHLIHWQVAGRTLAPLELNEVMHTLELGIVTAGFIFMSVAFLSVLIFGRFFCSWACHILALEDLCAWLLGKIGIHPKPVRARVLMLIAPAALFYMFVWPQIARVVGHGWPALTSFVGERPEFDLRIATDSEGWASFVTTEFSRNLPGPWIALLTFFLCGFAIVYFLGTRSFCNYACPYGALFGIADRFSPGRIILHGNCVQCQACTKACTSDIIVHEEIAKFGKVVNPQCLKDLDCVTACSTSVIQYGFTPPSPLQSFSKERPKKEYAFSIREEVGLVVVFLIILGVYRGLYSSVPFLMTLGLGCILAPMVVVLPRVFCQRNVVVGNFELKKNGKTTATGSSYVFLCLALIVFTFHSGFIRYHEFESSQIFETMKANANQGRAKDNQELGHKALGHLQARERWGLFPSADLDAKLDALYYVMGPPRDAIKYQRRVVARDEGDSQAHLRLLELLVTSGAVSDATKEAQSVLDLATASGSDKGRNLILQATAHEALGAIALKSGNGKAAISSYTKALALHPDQASTHLALGEVFGELRDLEKSVYHLKRAVELSPDSAPAHYALAVIEAARGNNDAALDGYENALALNPDDADSENNIGLLLAQLGRLPEAKVHLKSAIRSRPLFASPHFNLARVLWALGDKNRALPLFRRAAELDPAFVPYVPKPTPDIENETK